MWFILESLPEMPLSALHEAGEMLMAGLLSMMPEAKMHSQLITADVWLTGAPGSVSLPGKTDVSLLLIFSCGH